MKPTLFHQKISNRNSGPLKDMVAVAIVDHVSGPLAASELAKKGATVFKIEPESGDPARKYLIPEIFSQLNQGLLSVIMESSIYKDLLSIAHVIIDNRSPQAKLKDKILQDFLKSNDGRIIYCSISGYGDEYSLPVMDVIAQAVSGISYTNADAEGNPLQIGYTLADINAGKTAATEVATTWLATRLYPEEYPSLIQLEVTLLGELLNQQSGQILTAFKRQELNKSETIRKGNQNLFLSPFSFYQASDGYVAIAIATDLQFKKLCTVLDKEEWISKYSGNQNRVMNDCFNNEFSETIKNKSCQYWVEQLSAHNLPTAKVNTMFEALNSELTRKYIGKNKATGFPVVKSACTSSVYTEGTECELQAPKLNQHYDDAKQLIKMRKENPDFSCNQYRSTL